MFVLCERLHTEQKECGLEGGLCLAVMVALVQRREPRPVQLGHHVTHQVYTQAAPSLRQLQYWCIIIIQ